MIVLVAFLAFTFSLISLYISRIYLAGKRPCTGDTFFHLLISDSIKQNNWRYPKSLNHVVLDEGENKYNYLAYPPLLHYIIALFPAKHSLKISRLLNLFILSFVSTLASVTVYALTSSISLALLSSFIVVFNMSIFELEVMFTPRPLGLLFYSFLFYAIVFYPQDYFLSLIVAAFVCLIALTHKFAVQVVLFTVIPYAVLFNELSIVLSLGFGFLLAIAISRGAYLKILKEHVNWLYFYSHFKNRSAYLYKIRRIFVRNLWYFAILIPMLAIFVIKPYLFLLNDIDIKILFWAFIPLAVALFVMIPKLSFLGEDYRYIEYAVVPVGIILAILLLTTNIFVILATAFCFLSYVFVFIKYKKYLHKNRELVEPDDITSYSSLKSYGLNNLLVFPPTRTLEINYFTKSNVIHVVRANSTLAKDALKDVLGSYKISYVLNFRDTDPFKRFETLNGIVTMELIFRFKNFDVYKLLEMKTENPAIDQ